jgi:hypothetical protein
VGIPDPSALVLDLRKGAGKASVATTVARTRREKPAGAKTGTWSAEEARSAPKVTPTVTADETNPPSMPPRGRLARLLADEDWGPAAEMGAKGVVLVKRPFRELRIRSRVDKVDTQFDYGGHTHVFVCGGHLVGTNGNDGSRSQQGLARFELTDGPLPDKYVRCVFPGLAHARVRLRGKLSGCRGETPEPPPCGRRGGRTRRERSGGRAKLRGERSCEGPDASASSPFNRPLLLLGASERVRLLTV